MSACTPYFRASRPTMISRCRSPSPRISVCCSSALYSCWNVGSSSCSLCRPFDSFSSSPRCFTSIATLMTGSGNGILRSTIGASRVDSVSFVCVSRNFATTPMSPACSSAISKRSFPTLTHRWLSFSTGDRLVSPDLLAAQVALEQRIVSLGDALDQLLRVALEPFTVLRRDVHLLVLARLRPLLVQVALLREQIDDPMEVGAFTHGDLHRDHLRRELPFDLLVHPLEAGVLLVHQRDEEQPRDAAPLTVVPDLLGAHLDPTRGGDDHHGAVRGVHARQRLPREVEIAGRVDEVA